MSQKFFIYSLLTGYVLLSSIRDVGAEWMLKRGSAIPSDVFLFFLCLGMFVAGITGNFLVSRRKPAVKLDGKTRAWIMLLNVIVVIIYWLSISAIKTSAGAAASSFVDYGLTPVFAVFLAWPLLGERPQARYLAGLALALLGIYLFSNMNFHELWHGSSSYLQGLGLALSAGALTAIIAPANKKLINAGLDPWQILSYRMLFPALVFLAAAIYNDHTAYLSQWPMLLAYGLVFGALPIVLGLTALKQIEVNHLTIWMFLIPICTFLLSAALSFATLNLRTATGALLVLVASAYMEKIKRCHQP